MKKQKKNFQMDPRKKYIKKFRIYPYFLYSRLDRWLKSMSANGWHIVHCGWFMFWFEQGEPLRKEYFTYGLSTQEGKYSLSLRYPFLEKTYGVKVKKSRINSNEKRGYRIIEIDLQRIDTKKDIAYKELVSDRNRLYWLHFARTLALFLGASIILALFYLFGRIWLNS